MSDYRYKEDSDIDAYGDTQSVIHFKFGDARKMYNFTKELQKEHPKFCKEYDKYWMNEPSLFSDPLAIVNYIDTFNIPVRLYSNYVDQEFADCDAVREWIVEEYSGQNHHELYQYKNGGYVGLDGESSEVVLQ